MSGAPTVTASPSPIISTWSKATLAPGSPSSFSTTSRSPGLDPVLFAAGLDHSVHRLAPSKEKWT